LEKVDLKLPCQPQKLAVITVCSVRAFENFDLPTDKDKLRQLITSGHWTKSIYQHFTIYDTANNTCRSTDYDTLGSIRLPDACDNYNNRL